MTHRVWMVGFTLLTAEQQRIVTLPIDDNQLVLGPAGSGKTVLLLHRANYLLRNRQIAPHRLRVLVFTNVLRNYIQSGAESLGLPQSVVQSFYSWVFELAREKRIHFVRNGTLADQCRNALMAMLAHFEKNHVTPTLDVALVDEGQDLPPEAYRLLARAACHVTACADYRQRLYSDGVERPEASYILGVRDNAIIVLHNLRSNISVRRLAASFLPETERQLYLPAQGQNTLPPTVRIPLLFRASSADEQWERMACIVRQEIGRNARVGLLLPSNDLLSEVHTHLSRRGIPAETIAGRSAHADFNELIPKVLTIFSAKGLSFDSVLIPCVTEEHYRRRPATAEKLLFVACTRALDWVCLSTITGQELGLLSRARELIATGYLIEQAGGRLGGHPKPAI